MEILVLVIHHCSYSILAFLMFIGGVERHRVMKWVKCFPVGKSIYRQIISKPVASEQANNFQYHFH